MEVNMNFIFKTLDGDPIREIPNDKNSKEVTLKKMCENALLGSYQDEKIDGSEKAKRYSLAMDIHKANGKIDLESEDIVLLKKLLAKIGSPLVVGQAYEIMESKKKK